MNLDGRYPSLVPSVGTAQLSQSISTSLALLLVPIPK